MRPGTIVGRAAQLGELVDAWSSDRPRNVVITGAPGVGKSALVAAALDALTPPPSVVLSGTARVHTPSPYDWLAAILTGRDNDDLPVPGDALAWLAQHPDAPRERYAPGALLRLAVTVVRALVGAGPGVLVVEDLHALDPASLNLIGELAVVPDLHALIVVTSQPPDAAVSPDVVARTIARLAGTPGAVRQHLGPLGPDEVAAILADRVGRPIAPEVVAAGMRHSDGNPYRLLEWLAAGGAAAETVTSALPELTARELEVLSCLAAGMSNKQVARSLGISIRTVTVHVSNLLRKTRSTSRTEAALWALRHR
ncbi:AAA family ATPase [Virgisporangium ochraceum]|uniref:HTH luxR-type domain-containing protein n=1 Tax=Virgisporangium ochraceum TaxID=65505 RepID=A0A8J4E8Q4_9ACTN|nr:AAA family ATPase [Virgisporangium ochraceum]GIJ65936.1 hypothetical protein Voc01_008530 [Virgisporangium ochraceum]